jgi:hypothetical protein
MSQPNKAYDALCDLTTSIVTEARAKGASLSRLDGFREACRRRPDLASTAVGPTGERYSRPAAHRAAAAVPPTLSAGARSFAEQLAASVNSPLVKVCAGLGAPVSE